MCTLYNLQAILREGTYKCRHYSDCLDERLRLRLHKNQCNAFTIHKTFLNTIFQRRKYNDFLKRDLTINLLTQIFSC